MHGAHIMNDIVVRLTLLETLRTVFILVVLCPTKKKDKEGQRRTKKNKEGQRMKKKEKERKRRKKKEN